VTDSTTACASLDTIAHLLGGPRIDQLLTRAAERAPDRYAIRTSAGDMTYASLDTLATRCGAAMRTAVGRPDVVVALAMHLSPMFPVSFFGIARSGNISALVNPLLPDDRLAHVLASCGAQAAIMSPATYRRVEAIRDRLADLKLVVLTHRDSELESQANSGPPTLDDLISSTAAEPSLPANEDEQAVACLQFTSGTTGAAKIVQLTHRNLTVNAAQTAYAHRLTESSVLFNYLPTFHLMHLTIGVTVVATHVLWADEDTAGSIKAANRYRATHYYSLPVRLSRLAIDPRLPELKVPTLSAILSGGSALSPSAITTLTRHFGVPVVQGYGLAETSPSTHLGNLDKPKIGSAGQPAPGTECRIVDVDSRAVLPCATLGEIQVRGPQLMKGYLGRDLADDTDTDGWFSTGDVGYVDDEGYLFVVDRIKDVFKCDNWLVSPTEIERVLMRHPTVADCVVFDYPDEFSGSVAYGLVVPRDHTADPAELAQFVNAQVPYYEQLQHVELVGHIPRSATGKLQRRDLRQQILRRNTTG
jgi:long-chain acyl-CoA synthetase